MEKIDWQEITEELGEDRWRDDWINLPRQSRLLLSKFVQEYRFLSRDSQQVYYGPDSQIELYEAAKIAYNSLMNPITIQPLDDVSYGLATATSMLLAFPGIVGVWPMSVVGQNGTAVDISGNGNHLTNNNASLFNGSGVFPYVSFNGTSQYLSHADAAQFDILGNEAWIGDNNGLTMGAWVRRSGSSDQGIISKGSGINAYHLTVTWDGKPAGLIGNGMSYAQVKSPTPVVNGEWFFTAFAFYPGQKVSLFVDGQLTEVSTGIANINNNTVPFYVGNYANLLLTGDVSRVFLSMAAVPDASIQRYYEASRSLYVD